MNDETTEQLIQEKGKTAPRVTLAIIKDRISKREFHRLTDVLTVCVLTLVNGFTVTGESACASPENYDEEIGNKIAEENAIPYRLAMATLRQNPDGGLGALARLVAAVMPLYEGKEPPVPGIVMYYSPKALLVLNKQNPRVWPRPVPPWDFKQLERVFVPGTEGDDFAWFKYRAGV